MVREWPTPGEWALPATLEYCWITLPWAAGHTMATIKAGAADLDISIPQGVAARVRAQVGLSSLSIDQARFPKTGDYFISPEYEQATNRLDIRLDSGLASVNIR